MTQTLHYRFNIGDRVRLTKKPECQFSISYYAKPDVPNKGYMISGWRWEEDKPGEFKQYYILKIESDEKYLNYNNQIIEDEIELFSGEAHPFDISTEILSHDNVPIEIGMKLYTSIFYGSKDKPYLSPDMTFTKYGEVVRRVVYLEKGYSNPRESISVRREFLCTYSDGTERRDGAAYGHVGAEHPYGCIVHPDAEFAREYIDKLFKDRNSAYLTETNRHYYEIHAYLEHMGIWNEVMRLYDERKSGKKPEKKTTTRKKTAASKKPAKPKKSNLEAMLAGLSEEDKKKLKQLLE